MEILLCLVLGMAVRLVLQAALYTLVACVLAVIAAVLLAGLHRLIEKCKRRAPELPKAEEERYVPLNRGGVWIVWDRKNQDLVRYFSAGGINPEQKARNAAAVMNGKEKLKIWRDRE